MTKLSYLPFTVACPTIFNLTILTDPKRVDRCFVLVPFLLTAPYSGPALPSLAVCQRIAFDSPHPPP
jgi:hypothetical protein